MHPSSKHVLFSKFAGILQCRQYRQTKVKVHTILYLIRLSVIQRSVRHVEGQGVGNICGDVGGISEKHAIVCAAFLFVIPAPRWRRAAKASNGGGVIVVLSCQ